MDREACGILAKNIGAEDEVQSAYDNLADFLEHIDISKVIVDKIREIADEERTHRKEFNEIYRNLGCPIDELAAGTITTKNY